MPNKPTNICLSATERSDVKQHDLCNDNLLSYFRVKYVHRVFLREQCVCATNNPVSMPNTNQTMFVYLLTWLVASCLFSVHSTNSYPGTMPTWNDTKCELKTLRNQRRWNVKRLRVGNGGQDQKLELDRNMIARQLQAIRWTVRSIASVYMQLSCCFV